MEELTRQVRSVERELADARRHATELEVVIQAMRASTEETDCIRASLRHQVELLTEKLGELD